MSEYNSNSKVSEIEQDTSHSLHECLDHLRTAVRRLEAVEREKKEELNQISVLVGELTALSSAKLEIGPGLQINAEQVQQRAGSLEDEVSRIGRAISKLRLLSSQIEVGRANITGDESAHVADPWENALQARVIQGQEEERSRLAREIHDGPAQVLSNAIMGLDFCEELAKRGSPVLGEELCKLRLGMREGLNELRHFIFNLRPAAFEELGLVGTLCRYIDDYQAQFGIEVAMSNAQLADQLSPEHEIVVFRVVQEALQNVRKHANAKSVDIIFNRPNPKQLTVSVTDNGTGFDYAKASLRKGPLGLTTMRERAETIGGTVHVKTTPDQGTEVMLSVPCGRG